jgi:uncharacterized damage-inducible protein DinB
MEWADARMWQAVGSEPPVDAKLGETLVHIHVVQRAFLTAWRGGNLAAALKTPSDFSGLADVQTWARPYYAEGRDYITGLPVARLEQPFEIPWAGEVAQYLGCAPSPTTLAETCLQVTSHTTHHRGQINARLRELGREPLIVDYIAWLWLGPPAEWTA